MKDASINKELLEKHSWESGWAEHEAQQRLRQSQLSLAEKLLWLEQAQRMAIHLQKSRLSRASHKEPGGGQ
jgi:hypothetical protein